MSIEVDEFGIEEGQAVFRYTLTNKNGLSASLGNFGATWLDMRVPDSDGNFDDIILGYDSFAGYRSADNPYFSCTTGRYANRIGEGKFSIDGTEYQLDCNDGVNHLHGGLDGLNIKIWDAEIDEEANSVSFYYTSPDGESSYPGTLDITVIYTLTDDDELTIAYRALTDKSTIVNLTNHAYFNLNGNGNGLTTDHMLRVNADHYLPGNADGLPTGEIASVADTPFDLRDYVVLQEAYDALAGDGFDHNFCLNKASANDLSLAAELISEKSGRKLTVYTREPGVQVYGAIHMGPLTGKGDKGYDKYSAVCLETQHYPDSPSQAEFPSTILRPDEEFSSLTVHKFETL